MINLKEFYLGWRRKSPMILDNAGAPTWLIRLRCGRPPRNWGTTLLKLAAYMEDPMLRHRGPDDG